MHLFFSKYSGIDSEPSGVDGSVYPRARTYNGRYNQSSGTAAHAPSSQEQRALDELIARAVAKRKVATAAFFHGGAWASQTMSGSPGGLCGRRGSSRKTRALRTLLNKSLQHMSSTEQARWFVLGGDHLVLLDEQGQIPRAPGPACPPICTPPIFEPFDEWDGLPCYLLDLGPDAESASPAGLRQLMVAGDEEGFRLAGRAWQLATFRRTHRFCGECGAPMTPKAGEWAQDVPAWSRRTTAHLPLHHSGGAQGPGDPAGGPSPSLSGGGSHVYGAGGLRGGGGRTWSSAWRGRCSRRAASGCATCAMWRASPGPSPQPDDGLHRRLPERRDRRCRTTSWWPPASSRRTSCHGCPPTAP